MARCRLLLAGLLLVLGLASCGAGTVAAEQVADDAEKLLEQEYDVRPAITCPKEVPLEDGASTQCTLTAGDDPTEYGVTVTVVSVEDDEPEYRVEVDRQPLD
jgi:Domain of unknown function (DUF4333)